MATAMKTTKVVSVIGLENGGFPYFLTRSFEEKKYRILAIDNSLSHDLFLALHNADEDSDYVERGRTVFMRNKTVLPDQTGAFEKFDIVIIFHGLNVDYDLLDLSDMLVILTDYRPGTIREINIAVDMNYLNICVPKESLFLVYMDKSSGKISEQYIKKKLFLTEVENENVIYFDEGSYSTYINLCYNGSQSMKGLSSEYKKTLKEIRSAVIGDTRRKNKTEEDSEE